MSTRDTVQLVQPSILGLYYSADWGCDLNCVLESMEQAWLYYLESGKGWYGSPKWAGGKWEPHPAEVAYGGPLPYIEDLCTILERDGGFHMPLQANRFGPSGLPILHNGNHRAIASLLTGIPITVQLLG
jgi:hypothetical protein